MVTTEIYSILFLRKNDRNQIFSEYESVKIPDIFSTTGNNIKNMMNKSVENRIKQVES